MSIWSSCLILLPAISVTVSTDLNVGGPISVVAAAAPDGFESFGRFHASVGFKLIEYSFKYHADFPSDCQLIYYCLTTQ